MKYSPILYARSLFAVLKDSKPSSHESVIKKFWETVRKNGDESRVGKIVNSFEEITVKDRGGRVVLLETAREIPHKIFENFQNLFNTRDLVKKKVNDTLVAGVRVEVDGDMELDYSLNSKFRKMFT